MPNNFNLNEDYSRRNAERGVTRGYRHRRMREIMSILSKHEITKGLTPEKLRDIIEDLGPTFVKLGQILSMRRDIFPEEYCLELEKLRTDVRPLPFVTIQREIEREYNTSIHNVFKSIDPTPLGSASIAQVHYGVLLDGSEVVVKVQRPNVYETMAIDMSILDRATKLIQMSGAVGNAIDFKVVLDETWVTARQEMDFLIEARNAERFASNNQDIVYISSPKIYHQYTTSRVLMMEYVDGIDINRIDDLKEAGYDMKEISVKLAENYIKQVIDDAFFHADPHPGNIRIRNGQIVWIDLGMMGTLTKRDCEIFRDAITAVGTKNVDKLETDLLMISKVNGRVNHARLYADLDDFLKEYGTVNISEINLALILQDLLKIANDHHLTMPKGVTMFMRSVMTMEGVLTMIDPDTNIVEIMYNHVTRSARENLNLKEELTNLGLEGYSAGKKALEIPKYTVDLLKSILRGQSKFNLDITGSKEPLRSLDRMVNRLVAAMIIAALVIGSSFIATTNMNPKILGIPFLGFFGFLAAVTLSFIILINVYINDRKNKKDR